ncbi:MAG: hypothetical protein PHR83_19155 [Paludibacter sp.]|nr:hypothetical protein [Paludibacter sp.]
MKKFEISILLFVVSLHLYSQKIRMIKTKDLIHISDSLGVDHVLDIVSPQSICYIDPIVASYFTTKIDMNHLTDKEEWFLREFYTSQKTALQKQTQNSYIENKIKLVEEYVPDKLGVFPFIEESEMYFLTVNPDQNREKLLIDYYNAWSKRSESFKTDYDRERSTTKLYSLNYSSPDKAKIQSYLLCKENCHKILLALREVGSKFATDQKMEESYKILQMSSKETKKIRNANPHITEVAERVLLSREYNSIGEINYESEPELKKVINISENKKYWIDFIYTRSAFRPQMILDC